MQYTCMYIQVKKFNPSVHFFFQFLERILYMYACILFVLYMYTCIFYIYMFTCILLYVYILVHVVYYIGQPRLTDFLTGKWYVKKYKPQPITLRYTLTGYKLKVKKFYFIVWQSFTKLKVTFFYLYTFNSIFYAMFSYMYLQLWY